MSHLGSAVRRTCVATLLTLAMITGVSAFAAGTATAAGNRATPGSTVVGQSAEGKIRSTVVGKTSTGDKVSGAFTPIRAVEKDGVLAIKGFLQGVITDDAGKKTRFSGIKTIPVKKINGTSVTDAAALARTAAACNILNLVLGPLDLNILGLRIQLNQVKLDITAIPGGGLLGDLLCAVANLLSGGPLGGLLGNLRTLLNQILGLLNLGL